MSKGRMLASITALAAIGAGGSTSPQAFPIIDSSSATSFHQPRSSDPVARERHEVRKARRVRKMRLRKLRGWH